MKLYFAPHIAVLSLICSLPIYVHAADAGAGTPAVSGEDLTAASERIRQTGAQMREDLKKARARLEAQKAQQEAERARQEAEKAHQEAERKRQEELERQQALKEKQQREAQLAAQERARKEAAARADRPSANGRKRCARSNWKPPSRKKPRRERPQRSRRRVNPSACGHSGEMIRKPLKPPRRPGQPKRSEKRACRPASERFKAIRGQLGILRRTAEVPIGDWEGQTKSGARGAAKNPVWQEEERLGKNPYREGYMSEYRSISGECHRYIDPLRCSDFELRRKSFFLEHILNARYLGLLNVVESRTIPGIQECRSVDEKSPCHPCSHAGRIYAAVWLRTAGSTAPEYCCSQSRGRHDQRI